MANFPRVKPAGWAANEIYTNPQANALDIAHTKAPNFDEGSAHAPAANIELTGPQGIKLMGTQKLLYASRNVIRNQPLVGSFDTNFSHNAFGLEVIQNIAGGSMRMPITNIPHGATWQKVRIRVTAAAGHTVGNITATPLELVAEKWKEDDGVPTPLGNTVDTTVTGTYQAPHNLEVAALAEVIDLTTYRYQIRVNGEVGGDVQTGLVFTMLWTEFDVTQQPEY